MLFVIKLTHTVSFSFLHTYSYSVHVHISRDSRAATELLLRVLKFLMLKLPTLPTGA